MKINLTINTAEAKAQLRAYGGKLRTGAIKAAARGLQDERGPMQAAVQAHVRGALGGSGKLEKSFKAKVYDKKQDRFPEMRIYSKVPWAGAHEYGATINGKMLIPLGQDAGFGTRGARGKTFRQNIKDLMRGGNAYFIKTGHGKVLLMAENIKGGEYDRQLSGFKRRHRKAHGIEKLRRGAMIPIAILVNKVTLKKRTDVESAVISRVPELASVVNERLKTELFE